MTRWRVGTLGTSGPRRYMARGYMAAPVSVRACALCRPCVLLLPPAPPHPTPPRASDRAPGESSHMWPEHVRSCAWLRCESGEDSGRGERRRTSDSQRLSSIKGLYFIWGDLTLFWSYQSILVVHTWFLVIDGSPRATVADLGHARATHPSSPHPWATGAGARSCNARLCFCASRYLFAHCRPPCVCRAAACRAAQSRR